MPALNATAGSATANSYVSLEEAQVYYQGRLDTLDWDENTDKWEAALITAARRLDQENFTGSPSTSGQALRWPRLGGMQTRQSTPTGNVGGYTANNGISYDYTSVPQPIKDAQCEMALYLLQAGANTDTQGNVASFQGGGIAITYSGAAASKRLPENVARLLGPFIQGARIIRS